MKINQVEELVGITKKNIRFYEEQGLVRPGRNQENGYREYSLQDVEQLSRVKLLRQLGIPCSRIREVLDGTLSFDDCMEQQMQELDRRGDDLERMKEMCGLLSREVDDFSQIRSSDYLARMAEMEKGGTHFMDISKSDVSKRKAGAIAAAAVSILYMALMIAAVLWAYHLEPIPPAVIVLILIVPAAVIVGVLAALRQRMRELKGGELDEAGKY